MVCSPTHHVPVPTLDRKKTSSDVATCAELKAKLSKCIVLM